MQKELMIEIYSGTMWDAEMIMSLLASANIEPFLRNTILNSYAYDPIRTEGVTIMIPDSNLERAKEIIDEYYKST